MRGRNRGGDEEERKIGRIGWSGERERSPEHLVKEAAKRFVDRVDGRIKMPKVLLIACFHTVKLKPVKRKCDSKNCK